MTKEQIDETVKNIKVGDKVKFAKYSKENGKTKTLIKRGRVVRLTDCGAYIYAELNKSNSKVGEDYDVTPDTSEWYPFVSRTDGVIDGGITILN